MKKPYKTLLIFFLIILIFPSFILAQEEKELAKRAIEGLKDLPNILIDIFKEVLSFWKKLWDWFLENVWKRVVNWIKRKPEEELKKRIKIGIEEEKKELEEEKKNLWQKFLDWLKNKVKKR